ncbi:N-acetyltransferase 9-like protein isoform X1 [Exaiptasia diaphana]|uniref:N-acetyltransferase 9-like protein n=1 Tax=Exaiptasia diaphana TaxID=2652724 RepID=A0A913X5U2_EXADI|nr:N-acetyltransferase 9-like protein isoform X1 [Exaiptasia diaphana]KXJ14940.1 N-acetyltransferase 9-like protein [Exaiptasia diaphana]
MKINSSTVLVGDKVVLVPYKEHHVTRYHDWMQSSELLAQTASERLTLDQEYEMQKSWYEDTNKCTFIVLDKRRWRQSADEIDSMVGDVNLFFNDENDPQTAEVEVMIAEPTYRGQGLGKESVLIMMHYGVSKVGARQFTAKIGYNNKPSLILFNKLGFSQVSSSDVFQEMTLQLYVDDKTLKELNSYYMQYVTEQIYPYTTPG